MNNQRKHLLTLFFTGLSAGAVLLSGILKLIHFSPVIQTMQRMGVIEHLILLASLEISFTALYIYPKTMRIGFVLLSCYFAGALATELSHQAPLVAIGPLLLIWVSAFLRDKSVLFPSRGTSS